MTRSTPARSSGPRRSAKRAEDVVEAREPLGELLPRDDERRRDEQHVSPRVEPEAAAKRLADERLRLDRLLRLAVPHELETPEEPQAADIADHLVPRGEVAETCSEHLPELRRPLGEPVLVYHRDRRGPDRARKRMAARGHPA